MSLINDALRRAKQAQEQAPRAPAPHLPFRPVEPAQHSARHGLGLLVPTTVLVVALLGLMLVWHWIQTRGGANPTEVNARMANVQPTTAPALAPPPSVSSSASAAEAAAAAALVDNQIANMEEGEADGTSAAVGVEPPPPAPLKLQGILYNPKQPSAMISGRTVFVGDKVGDLRVAAIGKDSAILVGAGQTNVLSLPH
jgi:hypothetical protein